MSEQGGGEAAAAAAAAPAPASSEQERRCLELEHEMRELKEEIKELKIEIAADKAEARAIENEALEVELRRSIATNTERLNGLEQDRRDLRLKIEQLLAPVGHPTAAGGSRSPLAHRHASVRARHAAK